MGSGSEALGSLDLVLPAWAAWWPCAWRECFAEGLCAEMQVLEMSVATLPQTRHIAYLGGTGQNLNWTAMGDCVETCEARQCVPIAAMRYCAGLWLACLDCCSRMSRLIL